MGGLEVVILAGGKGTRAYPETADTPKPLLTVHGVPVVQHVMEIYAAQGHRKFVLAAGYRSELLDEHFRHPPDGWDVSVLDTGEDTATGDRLVQAGAVLEGERFHATYADGLAPVDLAALEVCHREAGNLVTVTTVPLRSQFGTLVIDERGKVTRFDEKPVLHDHWINAGFFLVERRALSVWEGQDLEREVLPALARRGSVGAYRHEGFWKSMDTYKDRQELEALATAPGGPPWALGPGAPDTRRR